MGKFLKIWKKMTKILIKIQRKKQQHIVDCMPKNAKIVLNKEHAKK